eukprot:TRINITY_DN3994_c0_g1_i4.p1 TRINITY_DN3994_c0_g1~~TRINITY_DN3994_c0_g1_i4.p1  ORF type:complete len:182 (+),score=32.16 TRINITY_DN3994_c0_g1_i4:77-622(+)
MVFCPECGENLGATAPKFCVSCGHAFGAPAKVHAPAPKKETSKELKTTAASNIGPSYGLSAEVKSAIAGKYSPAKEKEVVTWMEKIVGRSVGSSLAAGLRSGIYLCDLANALKPGTIKRIEKSTMTFKQMENINAFLVALQEVFKLPATDCFMTVDLYEEKNMTQVVDCLIALKRKIELGK